MASGTDLRRLILLLFLMAVPVWLSGQESNLRLFRFFEVYGGIGTSHYFGDIGGASTRWPGFLDKIDNFRDFDLLETRVSLSGGARYIFNRSFAVSGQLAPIWLSGDDAGSIHHDRGWSFNTYMLEASGQFEYYWLRKHSGFNPYFLAGFGATARYTVAYYPHLSTAFYTGNVILGGFGFRLSNNKAWTHSAELAYHHALSDYIEMFNGQTGKNDGYYTVQYKLSRNLTRGTIYNNRGLVRQNLWKKMELRKKAEKTDEELLETGGTTYHDLTKKDRRKIDRYLKSIRK